MKICTIGRDSLMKAIAEKASAAGHNVVNADDLTMIKNDCDIAFILERESLNKSREAVKTMSEVFTGIIAVVAGLTVISGIARDAHEPERVMGIRLISPEFGGKHVELTRGMETDDGTFNAVRGFFESFTDLVVESPDVIGGMFYRILPLQANMGAHLVAEGVTPVDVDNAILYGTNTKRQPLHIADEIGLDVLLDMLERIYAETGRSAYRPAPLLKKLVNAGRLGKKSGIGFFRYE